MAKILKGKPVAENIRQQSLDQVADLKARNIHPSLAIIQVGDKTDATSYQEMLAREADRIGIQTKTVQLEKTSSTQVLGKAIQTFNQDSKVHGLLVMQPLPDQIRREEVSQMLNPQKDVDGFSPVSLGMLVENNPQALVPSTPKAVMELLSYYGYEVKGREVCVVGCSPVVGKPLGLMLLNQKATVTTCHLDTRDTRAHTRQADIVISATGDLGFIDASYIKEGAVVIDVGYGIRDGEVMGDVNFDSVYPKAEAITPVPGGIGEVTTAVLLSQVVKAAQIQNGKE